MSQGRDETKIKREIASYIIRAVGSGNYARMNETNRRRIEQARDGIYAILMAEGFRPDATAMTHERYPAQMIPERNTITFWHHEYPSLIVEPQPYEVALADHVIEWLNARAPGWVVTFDRGDFGEGTPKAELVLLQQRQALSFLEEFGKRPSQPVADGSDLENDDLYEDDPQFATDLHDRPEGKSTT